jgi:hypothetical protein
MGERLRYLASYTTMSLPHISRWVVVVMGARGGEKVKTYTPDIDHTPLLQRGKHQSSPRADHHINKQMFLTCSYGMLALAHRTCGRKMYHCSSAV